MKVTSLSWLRYTGAEELKRHALWLHGIMIAESNNAKIVLSEMQAGCGKEIQKMTLAQEGYEMMKDMPAGQLKPVIQLLRILKEQNKGSEIDERMKAFEELNRLREECSRTLPDDFDPDKELALAMEERYGRTH